jgi:hypothetical protein
MFLLLLIHENPVAQSIFKIGKFSWMMFGNLGAAVVCSSKES